MWEPSSEWSGLHSALSRSGKRVVKRRRSVRGVSPRRMSSSNSLVPVPSPPTCFVTHVVTSTVARLAFGCASPGNRGSPPLFLSVEVLLEPAQVESAQHVSLGLAGLPAVVALLVPAVPH